MRKETINILTIYMIIGALINAVVLFLIGGMDISKIEKLITVIGVNACYIVIARDFAKAQEISCNKKNQHKSHLKQETKAHPIR